MVDTEEKNTLLVDYLESLGYSSFSSNGFKAISHYTDLDKEIDSFYSGVALRNISHLGIIELKGKDALDLIHRIGTNSVINLPKEGVKKTIFTSEKGRIIDRKKHAHGGFIHFNGGHAFRHFKICDGIAYIEVIRTQHRANLTGLHHFLGFFLTQSLKKIQLLNA